MEPLEKTEEILERIEQGESLRQICATAGFPSRQSFLRRIDDCPELADRYARARREGLDVIAEQIVEISDDYSDDANSRRVRVDSRKWLLSKLRPDKYGDRITQEHTGTGGGPITLNIVGVPAPKKQDS